MTRPLLRASRQAAAALLLAFATSAYGDLTIAQFPLFIGTGATPNVMLLVDNSGSMNNIIWDSGFDPKVTYPDWSPMIDHDCNTRTSLREAWDAGDGNINHSYLTSSNLRGTCSGSTNTGTTCSSGWTRGRNSAGTTTKCLKLPDPVGNGNTRYNGNYLNYLFDKYANNTDLSTGTIPNTVRMQVAKNVAKELVDTYGKMRLGLASFNGSVSGNPGPGGKINAACGTDPATLKTRINGLSASTNTPLAETYYEITRYFRGMDSYFNNDTTYESPLQFRCQKSFVIVITDGYPTYDMQFPTDDPDDPEGRLPNWDGLAPATTQSQYPNFPANSDGFLSGSQADEGYSLYLDDLAKFGYDLDMKQGGEDEEKGSWDDPSHPQQNLITYTVGFATANQMLADAAKNGDGFYYTASNEEDLKQALANAFSDIEKRTSSASAVAANSTRLTASTAIFQAKFHSANWSGELLAWPIGKEGLVGDVLWNAKDELPAPASRNIYTYDPNATAGQRGKVFEWDALTASQQAELNKTVGGGTDGNGKARLEWLRGDQSNEGAGLDFRARTSLLGDIINSDPAYVGTSDFGFSSLPGTEGSSYATFRDSDSYKNRRDMVYVAANDGMLHGFDAQTGEEVLAYMPNAVFPKLHLLTDKGYNDAHQLLNDGSPRVMDARVNGSWKTVLVGSLGGGGRGVYALDVTYPDNFGQASPLWEFTSAQDGDLGYTIPLANIGRLNNNSWAAIVANGYNSNSGKAVLFLIDLSTGAVLKKFDTGVGGDNGLSSPTPVDVDGDRIVDYVYAGDLKGNMWKFDLTSSDPDLWSFGFGTEASPEPLYTACETDPCGTRQPITARPEVGLDGLGGMLVYFGTGRYFADGDNKGTGKHTFYAIRDRNGKGVPSPGLPPKPGRSNLVKQEVIATFNNMEFGNSVESVRVTSNNPMSDAHDGWYIDLPASGEMQVSTPILRAGRIIFTTLIPSADNCSAGGTSWLMELDALSGSRFDFSPFDLNRDQQFDDGDFVTIVVDGKEIRVSTSGRQSKEGIIKDPAIIDTGVEDGEPGPFEYKLASGTSGGIDTTVENAGLLRGRQSWREIR